MIDLAAMYRRRFGSELEQRKAVYEVLCREFFQRYVPENAVVLDVAAGYCEFINHIQARRRLAVDLNPDVAMHAAPGVEVVVDSATSLEAIPTASIDVAFMSNFLEHLSRPDIVSTLKALHRVLKPGGRLLILQPNVRFAYRDYWMFFDHVTAIDDRSLCEALELNGYRVEECLPQFLPFSMKSRLPSHPLLVSAYLRFPPAWRLFGAQAFLVGRRC